MSATPRTDAAVYPMNGVEIVWPHFARTLETELAAMKAENQKLWNEKKWCERDAMKAEAELAAERDKVRVLREALTSY